MSSSGRMSETVRQPDDAEIVVGAGVSIVMRIDFGARVAYVERVAIAARSGIASKVASG